MKCVRCAIIGGSSRAQQGRHDNNPIPPVCAWPQISCGDQVLHRSNMLCCASHSRRMVQARRNTGIVSFGEHGIFKFPIKWPRWVFLTLRFRCLQAKHAVVIFFLLPRRCGVSLGLSLSLLEPEASIWSRAFSRLFMVLSWALSRQESPSFSSKSIFE